MDKLMLRLVLFFVKRLLRKNVNFEHLKIITETKLLTDRRRVRVSMKAKKENAEPRNQMLITQLVYAGFGLLVGTLVLATDDILLSMVMIHGYVLFMMAMTLITDFSSVMLDTADNLVILPRPVTGKTLFVSRLVHILVYLLQFSLALTFFPIIFAFIQFGPVVGLCMILTLGLTVVFAVFLTYLLYGIILRFANEEKIKDIISWFQIFMTVFFAVGYQVIPRLINLEDLKITLPLHWYAYLAPPVWMAMTLQAIREMHFDAIHLLMLICAVLIPAFTFWVMIKFLAPSFSKKLGAMGNDTRISKRPKSTEKILLSQKLSQLLSTNKTEQAGFELTRIMTSRDKNFKVQFYPSFAYILVFAFITVFKSGKDFAVLWASLGSTKMFLWFIYLPIFTIASAGTIIAFNENFTALWIYLAAPIRRPGSLISGALKSLLVKFFLPVFIILFSFSLYIWGCAIIDDFIFGFFNNICIFILLIHFGNHHLPFSMQPGINQQSGKLVKMILQLLLIGAIVFLHYLALKLSFIVILLIPVSATGCYFLFQMISSYRWSKIKL